VRLAHERYAALEELGRGGMGRVLRVHDMKLGRDVTPSMRQYPHKASIIHSAAAEHAPGDVADREVQLKKILAPRPASSNHPTGLHRPYRQEPTQQQQDQSRVVVAE
jgi:hypothetical protein